MEEKLEQIDERFAALRWWGLEALSFKLSTND